MAFHHYQHRDDFHELHVSPQDVVFVKDSKEIIRSGRTYVKPSWGMLKTTEFIFDQNGKPEDAFIELRETGLLQYLVENVRIYECKLLEDGQMLCLPLQREVVDEYYLECSSYPDGTPLADDTRSDCKIDRMAVIPAVYYRSVEISPHKYRMKFSASYFPGSHKVFGDDTLIGTGSGYYTDGGWYANTSWSSSKITFTQAREGIARRGSGYYGFTSDEMGVLMFLEMFVDGVNGSVIRWDKHRGDFLGIKNVFANGNDGRMYPPNISIDKGLCTVEHLDGIKESFRVPYIWGGQFNKLRIGEYLTIVPIEQGTGFYELADTWIGNETGIAIYTSGKNGSWSIAADRSDADATGVTLKVRPCFKGKIVETLDVAAFKSIPIIN